MDVPNLDIALSALLYGFSGADCVRVGGGKRAPRKSPFRLLKTPMITVKGRLGNHSERAATRLRRPERTRDDLAADKGCTTRDQSDYAQAESDSEEQEKKCHCQNLFNFTNANKRTIGERS